MAEPFSLTTYKIDDDDLVSRFLHKDRSVKVACIQQHQKGVGPRCEYAEVGDLRKEDCLREKYWQAVARLNFMLSRYYAVDQAIYIDNWYYIQQPWFNTVAQANNSVAAFNVLHAGLGGGISNLEECYCDDRVMVIAFEEDKKESDSASTSSSAATDTLSVEATELEIIYGNFFNYGNILWIEERSETKVDVIIGVTASFLNDTLRTMEGNLNAIVRNSEYIYKDGSLSFLAGDGASIEFIVGNDKLVLEEQDLDLQLRPGYRDVNYVYFRNVDKSLISSVDTYMFDIGVTMGMVPVVDDMLQRIDPDGTLTYIDPEISTKNVHGVRIAADQTFAAAIEPVRDAYNLVVSYNFNMLVVSNTSLIELDIDDVSQYVTTVYSDKYSKYKSLNFHYYTKDEYFQDNYLEIANTSDTNEDSEDGVYEYLGILPANTAAANATRMFYNPLPDKAFSIIFPPRVIDALVGDYVYLDDKYLRITEATTSTDALHSEFTFEGVHKATYNLIETDSSVYTIDTTDIYVDALRAQRDAGELIYLPVPSITYVDEFYDASSDNLSVMVAVKKTDSTKDLLCVIRDVDDILQPITITDEVIYGTLQNDVATPASCGRVDRDNEIVITFNDSRILSLLDTTTILDVSGDLEKNLLIVDEELIQFIDYEIVSGNTVRFYNLLRGRRGTDWINETHLGGIECYFYTSTSIKRIVTESTNAELNTFKMASDGLFYLEQTWPCEFGSYYVGMRRNPVVYHIKKRSGIIWPYWWIFYRGNKYVELSGMNLETDLFTYKYLDNMTMVDSASGVTVTPFDYAPISDYEITVETNTGFEKEFNAFLINPADNDGVTAFEDFTFPITITYSIRQVGNKMDKIKAITNFSPVWLEAAI